MINTIRLIILVALLSSCGWVEQSEIERAEKVCADNGGVNKIMLTNNSIYCNNGARFKRYE